MSYSVRKSGLLADLWLDKTLCWSAYEHRRMWPTADEAELDVLSRFGDNFFDYGIFPNRAKPKKQNLKKSKLCEAVAETEFQTDMEKVQELAQFLAEDVSRRINEYAATLPVTYLKYPVRATLEQLVKILCDKT